MAISSAIHLAGFCDHASADRTALEALCTGQAHYKVAARNEQGVQLFLEADFTQMLLNLPFKISNALLKVKERATRVG